MKTIKLKTNTNEKNVPFGTKAILFPRIEENGLTIWRIALLGRDVVKRQLGRTQRS